jgi:hypothetical protein
MKKNTIPRNQMGLPFEEAPYKPKEVTPPLPPIVSRNIVVRPKWKVNPAGEIFPEIRFGGKYLEEAGFQIGRAASLIVRKNQVVITLQGPDTKPEPNVVARLASIKTRRQSAAALRVVSV